MLGAWFLVVIEQIHVYAMHVSDFYTLTLLAEMKGLNLKVGMRSETIIQYPQVVRENPMHRPHFGYAHTRVYLYKELKKLD